MGVAGVVERWLPQARIRQDFLGIIDLIWVSQEHGIVGVQATSDSNHSARVAKALSEERVATLEIWLRSGGRFMVVSWGKRGAKGKRKLWQARATEIFVSQPESKIEKRSFDFASATLGLS